MCVCLHYVNIGENKLTTDICISLKHIVKYVVELKLTRVIVLLMLMVTCALIHSGFWVPLRVHTNTSEDS